jgi:hypothetical protein
VKETWQWCNAYMNLSEIDGDKPEALLIRRVPYYGINISAPYIVMRHWDEWVEKKNFKIDKKDIELCRLVMDIQHYSQKMYFGKYAEMYFDEKHKDQESATVHRKRKTDSYFTLMKEKFSLEDLEKAANISKKTAYNIVSRWIVERRLTTFARKKGYYIKAK